MKKLYLFGFLLMLILALNVSAAANLSLSSLPTVTAKPTKSFSTTLTVTNNGDVNLTYLGVVLSTTQLNNFNITINPSSFDLANGSFKIITINGTIPKNVDTKASPFLGTIIVSNAEISRSTTLSVVAQSQLSMEDVRFIVDGKSEDIENGDTRDNIKPGSELEIKGDIKNIFTDAEDIEIEDITIEITIKDIDDGDDLEEEVDIADIEADEKERFDINFKIPEDVEAGSYDVEILVKGEDKNGAKHFIEWNDVNIEVEKKRHDIQIKEATISPSKINCIRDININVKLKNQGQEDEDKIILKIENPDLDIAYGDKSIIELREGTGSDTEYEKTTTFKIGEDVDEGTYQLTIKSYYDTTILSNIKTIYLVVENCKLISEEKPDENEIVIINPPEEQEEDITITTQTPPAESAETTEISVMQSNTYLLLLVGAVGVAIIAIIVTIIVLLMMKKRQQEN